MTCLIIEDQRPAQEILEKYIQDLGSLTLTGVYHDALQVKQALHDHSVDLIFLDIHLPKLSGIEFLKTIDNPPLVILTTAFPGYALDGYDLDVVDYLLKPFSFQRFEQAVAKAHRQLEFSQVSNENAGREIFVKSGYELIRLSVNDICFLRSDSDYTEIHLDGTKYLTNEPLKYWEEELKSSDFIRIHKSYIVNFARIRKVAGSQVFLTEKMALPIGRAFKDEFNKRLLK